MSSSTYIFTYVNDQDIDSFLENNDSYFYNVNFLGTSGLISTHGKIFGDAISNETMTYINDKFETSYSYILDLNYSMNETSYVINKAIINLNDRISDTDARLETAGVWEKGTGTNAVQTKNANNVASGNYSVAEGYQGQASGSKSHAEGNNTQATGNYSHAEGYHTQATGNSSHAEGYYTQATSQYSHAEGQSTIASGSNSHAEGNNTQASSQNSHAEGQSTIASGLVSHAEGSWTQASGNYSHAEGEDTQTFNEAEHASGKLNISHNNTLFSVGNGYWDDNDDAVRQNAFEIMMNGDMYIYGVNKYDGKNIEAKKTVQNYLANIGKTIDIGDLSFLTESEVESIFIDEINNIIINIDEDRMIIFGKLIRNVVENNHLTGEQHLYIGVPHGTDMTDIDIKFYRYCKVINRNSGTETTRTKYKGLHEIWNGGPGDGQLAITPVFVDKTTVDFEQNNYDYYEVGGYCEWDDVTYDNFRDYCENTETLNKVKIDGDIYNLYIWELLKHKHNYLCLVKDNQIISGFIPINCNQNQDDSISLKL